MNAYDLSALRLLAEHDGALCTIVGIEGSYSRAIGSHLAIAWDGRMAGSLADGCLEAELATHAAALRGKSARIVRFGRGSPVLDFRLPCGSGIDIHIDPAPDRERIAHILSELGARRPATVDVGDLILRYTPPLRILALGVGPEVGAVERLAAAMDIDCETHRPADAHHQGLTLGQAPSGVAADTWTAILLLFHDHEWEQALLEWAIATPAFHIGAIGGWRTRERRLERLAARGLPESATGRIRAPVGLIPSTRDPATLALSILAQVVGEYDLIGRREEAQPNSVRSTNEAGGDGGIRTQIDQPFQEASVFAT